MKFPTVKKYTAYELERKASQVLRSRFLSGLKIPIDIDFLVENEPGVNLDCIPNIKNKFGVAGVIFRYKKNEFKIYIDENIADYKPNFYRFTLAEEFAHLILHRNVIENINSLREVNNLIEWSGYAQMERNAKRFAAAILMPPKCIINDASNLYPVLIKLAGFKDIQAIQERIADILSRKYKVSNEAMWYRLGEWPLEIREKIEKAMLQKSDVLF